MEWINIEKYNRAYDLPADSQTSEQLVAQRFSLSDGAQTPGGNLLSIELKQRHQISMCSRIL